MKNLSSVICFKKFNLKFFVYLITLVLFHETCIAQQQFYACTGGGSLYKINASNCSSTLVGYTNVVLLDIAICSDGKLYGTDSNYLYEIDTATAVTTIIGQNSNDLDNNLVCDKAGNLLSLKNKILNSINRYTGQSTKLGYIGLCSKGDLTFFNDTLYLSDCNNKLIQINLQNLSYSIKGTMDANNIYGINTLCYNNNPIMIATGVTSQGSSLYLVNISNGNLSLLCENIIINETIFGAASIYDVDNSDQSCKALSVSSPKKTIVRIFPNPASEFINIMSDNEGQCEIDIFDNSMKMVSRTKFFNSIKIELNQLPKGIYFYELKTSSQVSRGKILKE